MRLIQLVGRVGACLCFATAISASAYGQDRTPIVPSGGPLGGPAVLDAPFSADATTTVRQTLADGTRIERSGTARYYRDRAGRVRVEQAIIGLEGLNPAADRKVRITIYPDPAKGIVYTLDPETRTRSEGSRDIAGDAIGGWTFSVPLGGERFLVFHGAQAVRDIGFPGSENFVEEESLGQQRIAGLDATGRRIKITIPPGQFGNDRSVQVVDERWESPELKLVIYSRSSDPRTGVVEYRLANIRRAEPPADLFVVPADYTRKMETRDDPWVQLDFAERSNRAKAARGGGQQ